MRSACLIVVVFLCGAAVLALEILGTRILGPFHGVSLFLWSALITVTLAALSAGYALGGRWADRKSTFGGLAGIVAAAGAWTLLIPWLVRPALLATESFGLRLAVLATAALLFGPPLTLLGMVSPYAIRLRASSLEHVGRTAGNLYAISTVASVVSALAVGFFLIPVLGVARLTLAVGVALLVAASLAAMVAKAAPSVRGGAAGLLLLMAVLGATRAGIGSPDPGDGLVEELDSAYAQLKVLDIRNARHLLIDGGVHSIEDLDTGETWHRYAVALQNAEFLFDEPGKMLLVGLGGGSVAKHFAKAGWRVDVVEIDPAVGEMARKHFGLEDGIARTFWMDGRRYLRTTDETYDLIVVDAFGSSSIPFHLSTTEAFGLMRDRLAQGGILAINVETLGWHDDLLAGFTASLQPHFPELLALPTSEPPDALGNIVLLASARKMEFDEMQLPRPLHHLDDSHRHWWSLQLVHAWDNRFVPDARGMAPFTDDRNPVDLLSEEVNRQARFALHDYFRELGVPAW